MTPRPIAPPGMLLPDPRGTRTAFASRAHRTSATTSSALCGHRDRLRHNATDAGGLGVYSSGRDVFPKNTAERVARGSHASSSSVVVRILRRMTAPVPRDKRRR